MLASYKLKLFDYDWSIKVLDDHAFDKKFGETTEGLTDTKVRTIYVRRSALNYEVIAHEITHTYFHYFGVEAVQLKRHQIEELACEISAVHFRHIDKKAKQALINLKKKLK